MDYAQGRAAEEAGRVPPGYYTTEADEAFEEEAAAELSGDASVLLEILDELVTGDKLTEPVDWIALTKPEVDAYGLSASELLVIAVHATCRDQQVAAVHLMDRLYQGLQSRIEARAEELAQEAMRGDE